MTQPSDLHDNDTLIAALMARIMVLLEQAVEACPDVELIHVDELLRRFAPGKARAARPDTVIRTHMDWHGHCDLERTAPDQIFALRYRDREAGKDHRFIFLEID